MRITSAGLIVTLFLAVAVAPAGPAPEQAPTERLATVAALQELVPPPTAGPFRMNLYRTGDFVSQMDRNACVAAAMQTMINIMSPGADRSMKKQLALMKLARQLSTSWDPLESTCRHASLSIL